MKSGKIAVCISGELRTGIEAYPIFKEFFRGHDVDVFIHTWDKDLTEEQKKEVVGLYKPTSINFEHPLDIRLGSFGSMFYSMMRANGQKALHELETDEIYDVVVKYRFDLVFPKFTHFNPNIEPRTLYYTKHNHGLVHTDYQQNGISDVILWGDSETMDLVSDTYIYYKKRSLPMIEFLAHKRNYDPHYAFLSPGTLIYRLMVDHNIHPICVNGMRDILWRTDVKHLDPWNDYDKIKDRYEQV